MVRVVRVGWVPGYLLKGVVRVPGEREQLVPRAQRAVEGAGDRVGAAEELRADERGVGADLPRGGGGR